MKINFISWGLLFLSSIIDLILPRRCVICGQAQLVTHSVCKTCCDQVYGLQGNRCSCCNTVIAGGGSVHLCGKCIKTKPAFSHVIALTSYEGIVKKALQRLKFNADWSVLPFLSHFVTDSVLKEIVTYDVIVPVPLHKKRIRQRGFNQALLISHCLFGETGVNIVANVLERTQNSVSQASLSREKRLVNLRNAFVVKSPRCVRGLRVCLVDDILTTGATVNECAKILKKSGASDVVVCVIAITEAHV